MGDKELLLHVEKSDSELEEFKLPPPRSRRVRNRKSAGDTRILKSEPLISIRCVFTFVIVSIILSGLLLIGFYLLTIQLSLSKLQNDFTDHKKSADKKIKELEKMLSDLKKESGSKISVFELQNKEMTEQLNILNTTHHKNVGLLPQRIQIVEEDLNNIKNGLAHTGSEINKLEGRMDSENELLQMDIKKIQRFHENTLNRIAVTPEEKPTIDHSNFADKEYVGLLLKNLTNKFLFKEDIEKMLFAFKQELSGKEEKNSNMLLLELTNLKTVTDSLIISHNRDITQLIKNISAIKSSTENMTTHFTLSSPSKGANESAQILTLLSTVKVHAEELEKHQKQFESLGNELKELNKTVAKELTFHEIKKTEEIKPNTEQPTTVSTAKATATKIMMTESTAKPSEVKPNLTSTFTNTLSTEQPVQQHANTASTPAVKTTLAAMNKLNETSVIPTQHQNSTTSLITKTSNHTMNNV